MSRRWVISDTHFGHRKIIEMTSRPFSNIDSMDRHIIERWNTTVKEKDRIYILGDFALCGRERIQDLLYKLNGQKHLIMGNHDKHKTPTWWRECGFDEVSKYPIIIDGFVILSHEPFLPIWNSDYFVNIHGHIHNNDLDKFNFFNAGVEVVNYTPVNLDKVIQGYRQTGYGGVNE